VKLSMATCVVYPVRWNFWAGADVSDQCDEMRSLLRLTLTLKIKLAAGSVIL
jgi:hypothetical protein